jgi:hypothetical protein
MNRSVVAAASVAALIAGAGLLAQGFSLRTGSWSFTMTMQGMPLVGLPPEVQAELKKPQTFASCVTAEDLKNFNIGRPPDSDDEDCKTVSSKISATVADLTRECSGDNAGTETQHFEAATPQALKGTIVRKTAGGTTTIAISGTWVAPKCAE